jgi:hypothetical protein
MFSLPYVDVGTCIYVDVANLEMLLWRLNCHLCAGMPALLCRRLGSLVAPACKHFADGWTGSLVFQG